MGERLSSLKSLWAQYQKEINDVDVIEHEYGFVSYKLDEEKVHVIDVFVLPEFRTNWYFKKLEMELLENAREADCKMAMGTVDLKNNDSTRKFLFWLRMGAEVFKAHNDLVYFVKRI